MRTAVADHLCKFTNFGRQVDGNQAGLPHGCWAIASSQDGANGRRMGYQFWTLDGAIDARSLERLTAPQVIEQPLELQG